MFHVITFGGKLTLNHVSLNLSSHKLLYLEMFVPKS